MQKFLELTPPKIGILVTLIVGALFLLKPHPLEILESQMIDLRFKSRGPLEPGPEVILVVIDEKSQDVLGRWPWPRSVLARLVDKLTEYNAFTIGFDMVFSESGDDVYLQALRLIDQQAAAEGLGDHVLSKLRKNFSEKKTGDQRFAEAMARHGNVVLGFFFHDDPADIRHLSKEQIARGFRDIERFRYRRFDIEDPRGMKYIDRDLKRPAVEANLPLFAEAAYQAGYFNFVPDADGIVRKYPVVMKGGDHYYAPLWLHMIANYREKPNPYFRADRFGIQEVKVGDMDIPVDLKGQFLINYYGGPKTFQHYSVSDILEDKLSPEIFDSRIVLIGATGKGIYDLRATPFERVFPGVEINATIIDNIVQENFLKRPPWSETFTLLMILLFGAALTCLLSRVGPLQGFFTSLLFLLGYYIVNLELFQGSPTLNVFAGWFIDYQWIRTGYLLNLVYPSLEILLLYISLTTVNYFRENRQKQFIRGAFGQYLSPTVVRQLVENPGLLKLGGEVNRMTAFFSDVAGFSTISEKLTPQQLVALLNEYLTAMTDIILRYEGTVDKYEGDAIIAFWGAPLPHADHALRACLASLEMQNQLAHMRAEWKRQGRAELHTRIGLNTGLMTIGNMGSTHRMDYTIMGDSVNLASRLEGVNKVYGTEIMISQFTYEDVKDRIACRELDLIRVVGKTEPVAIYEVLGEKGELDPALEQAMSLFAEALACYRKKQWDQAIACFNRVLEIRPEDKPSQTFIERCLGFKNARKDGRRAEDRQFQLPEDWDGVYQMTSK